MADASTMTQAAASLNNFLVLLIKAREAHINEMKPKVDDFVKNWGKTPAQTDSKPSDGKTSQPGPSQPGPSQPEPGPSKPTSEGGAVTSIKPSSYKVPNTVAEFEASMKERGITYPFDKITFKTTYTDKEITSIIGSVKSLNRNTLPGRVRNLVAALPNNDSTDNEDKHDASTSTLLRYGYKMIPGDKGTSLEGAWRVRRRWLLDALDFFRVTHPNFVGARTYEYLLERTQGSFDTATSDAPTGADFSQHVDDDLLEASKDLFRMFNDAQ